METIKINMYVRTDLGNIGKIVEEYTHQNNKVSYPEPQEWVLDTGYILNEAMMYKNEEIIKASYNIIDLIEVGDHVNGKKVIDKWEEPTGAFAGQIFIKLDGEDTVPTMRKIETIATKEQFEQIQYRIGEE